MRAVRGTDPAEAQHGALEEWLRREALTARDRHPLLARCAASLWRHPAGALVPLALVSSGFFAVVIGASDADLFIRAGRTMLGPGFFDVFADPVLQIGPLYLLVVGVLAEIAGALGLPVLFTVAGAQSAFVAWLALVVTGSLARARGLDPVPPQWAVGGALVLGGPLADGTGSGHPEELAIGLLLALAATWADRGRAAAAGVLIGLTTGLKAWGVLGAGLALRKRRLRPLVTAAAACVVVTALCYLPFLVLGEVNTFSFRWEMAGRDSGLGRLSDVLGLSDWGMRVVQGAVAGGVGALVAARRHGSPLVVVVAVVSARLVLDPVQLTYYTGPLVAVLLIWCWTAPARPGPSVRVVALLLAPLVVLAPYALDARVANVVSLALYLAGPALLLRREHVQHAEARGLADASASRRSGELVP